MMKITGLSHLFKWENLHNWWLTKYFFAPLYIYIYIYIRREGMYIFTICVCARVCVCVCVHLFFLSLWGLEYTDSWGTRVTVGT